MTKAERVEQIMRAIIVRESELGHTEGALRRAKKRSEELRVAIVNIRRDIAVLLGETPP